MTGSTSPAITTPWTTTWSPATPETASSGAPDCTLRHNTLANNAGEAGLRVNNSAPSLNTIISGHTYGIRTTLPAPASRLTIRSGLPMLATPLQAAVNIATSHDLYGDPSFVDGTDPFTAYHLTETSPAIDAGVETAPTVTSITRAVRSGHRCRRISLCAHLTPSHRRSADPARRHLYPHPAQQRQRDRHQLAALSSQGWPVDVEPATLHLGAGRPPPVPSPSPCLPARSAWSIRQPHRHLGTDSAIRLHSRTLPW